MPVDGVGGDGRHAEAERGARQAFAAAELAGAVGGALKRLAGPVEAPGAVGALAEAEQQVAAQRLVDRRHRLERRDGRFEEAGRFLVGEHRLGVLGAAMRELDCLFDRAEGQRPRVVMRQLGEMSVDGAPAVRFDAPGDAEVQRLPLRRRDVAVERLGDQHVRETVAPGHLRQRDDQAAGDGVVHRRGQRGRGQIDGVAQQRHVELAAHHRAHRQRALGVGRGQRNALADRHAHAVRDAERVQRGSIDAAVGTARGRREQADDLADEERVAVGDAVDGRRRAAVDVVVDSAGDPFVHRTFAETTQRKRDALTAEVGDDLRQLRMPPHLGLAIGDDDEQLVFAQRPGDESQQQERREVGGVRVVENQDERHLRGRGAEERGDGVEDMEPIARDARCRRQARPPARPRSGPGGTARRTRRRAAIAGRVTPPASPTDSRARRRGGSRSTASRPGAPPASQQRPQATIAPRAAASPASSSASRVLPIPGSPASSTSRLVPASASARQARNSSHSRVRPNRPGRRDCSAESGWSTLVMMCRAECPRPLGDPPVARSTDCLPSRWPSSSSG